MEFSDEIRHMVPSLDLNIKVRKDKKAGKVMTMSWFSEQMPLASPMGGCL